MKHTTYHAQKLTYAQIKQAFDILKKPCHIEYTDFKFILPPQTVQWGVQVGAIVVRQDGKKYYNGYEVLETTMIPENTAYIAEMPVLHEATKLQEEE